MPRGFQLPTDFGDDAAEPSELWVPMYFDPKQTERGSHGFYAAGRLKPGVTAAQASDDLASIDVCAHAPKVSTRRRITSRRSPCRSTTRSSAASGGRSTFCWAPSAS